MPKEKFPSRLLPPASGVLILRLLLLAVFIAAQNRLCAIGKNMPDESHQLVLVTTKNWDAVPGTLRRFERAGETWREVAPPIQIVVGRNGLAWGRGLNEEISAEPQKKEGDGKSPAGIFRLSSAFGFAPSSEMNSLKIPYEQVTDTLECIDDIHSARYNSIVDRSKISKPDWNSSEKMREVGEQYRLGIVVDHNIAPRIAGKGSCIFLHIWKGDGSGTSGCTAMEKTEMEKLIRWLDAKANPVLVQLPENEFQRLQKEWKLPSLKTQTTPKARSGNGRILLRNQVSGSSTAK